MDLLTAITAVATMVTEITKGMSPEQKIAFWDGVLAQVARVNDNQTAVHDFFAHIFHT